MASSQCKVRHRWMLRRVALSTRCTGAVASGFDNRVSEHDRCCRQVTLHARVYIDVECIIIQLFALTLQNEKQLLVYTMCNNCVNSAFDSVCHKLELSALLFHCVLQGQCKLL